MIFLQDTQISLFFLSSFFLIKKIIYIKKEKHYILFDKVLFEEYLLISKTFFVYNDQTKKYFNLIQKYKEINQKVLKKIIISQIN